MKKNRTQGMFESVSRASRNRVDPQAYGKLSKKTVLVILSDGQDVGMIAQAYGVTVGQVEDLIK